MPTRFVSGALLYCRNRPTCWSKLGLSISRYVLLKDGRTKLEGTCLACLRAGSIGLLLDLEEVATTFRISSSSPVDTGELVLSAMISWSFDFSIFPTFLGIPLASLTTAISGCDCEGESATAILPTSSFDLEVSSFGFSRDQKAHPVDLGTCDGPACVWDKENGGFESCKGALTAPLPMASSWSASPEASADASILLSSGGSAELLPQKPSQERACEADALPLATASGSESPSWLGDNSLTFGSKDIRREWTSPFSPWPLIGMLCSRLSCWETGFDGLENQLSHPEEVSAGFPVETGLSFKSPVESGELFNLLSWFLLISIPDFSIDASLVTAACSPLSTDSPSAAIGAWSLGPLPAVGSSEVFEVIFSFVIVAARGADLPGATLLRERYFEEDSLREIERLGKVEGAEATRLVATLVAAAMLSLATWVTGTVLEIRGQVPPYQGLFGRDWI